MKIHVVGLVAGIVAVAALTGCSTPESRIGKNEAAFAKLPAADQARIRAGEVAVGFTAEMVTMALGKPDRVFRRETSAGESEVWAYADKAPRIQLGVGVGSGNFGGGVAVGANSEREELPRLQVTFSGGRVVAVEKRAR